MSDLHVVTGAFGYSGRYIAHRLLEAGHQVRTLTNSPQRANPFGDRVEAHPFHFDQPEQLVESLWGATVVYNTYWVRFNHETFRHAVAVKNTRILFDAARRAGVERFVHISITNPSVDSSLEYFRGKAVLERSLIKTGLSYAILRPAIIFGKEDILINNIAWVLRTFPIFGIFGRGDYRLQPIHVDDLAKLAVEQGQSRENTTRDAIGPETYTYRQMVGTIGRIIGKPRPLVSIPPFLGLLIGQIIGLAMGDVMITREEIDGLMQDLLATDSPPTGKTRFSLWAKEHANILGQRYASELARRQDRERSYDQL